MEIHQLQEDMPHPEGPGTFRAPASQRGLLPPASSQTARPRLLVASRTVLASTCDTVLPPVEKVPLPQIPSVSRFTLAEKVYGRGSKPPQSWRTITARQLSDLIASKPAWTGAVEPMSTFLPAQKPSEAAKRKVIVLPRLAPEALRPRDFPCFVVRLPDAVKPPINVPTALPRPLEGRAARWPSGGHRSKQLEVEEDLAAALPSGPPAGSFGPATETVPAPQGSAPPPDERSCEDAMAEEAAQDVVAWLVSGLRFSGAKVAAPLQERPSWMPLAEQRSVEEEMAEEASHQVVAWLMAGLRFSRPEELLDMNEPFLLLADVHSVQSWRSEVDEAVEETVEELLARLVRLEVSQASQDESEHGSWEWADQEWFEEALDLALEDLDWDACEGLEEAGGHFLLRRP